MLSRLVITFLPRSKQVCFNFMVAVTICSDFGAPQNKVCHGCHCSSPICHEGLRPDALILVFWMLSLKPTFSLSSFTFIKRLFSSSSLSAIRAVSCAYLRLLIFLPAILIPACASCFSGTLLLFRWSSGCWQFDLWFLCLFQIQLEHLDGRGSHIAEAWLGEFWALLDYCVRWVQLCGSLSILWHCLSLGLEWKLTFSSPVATAEFSKLVDIFIAALSQHHLLGFELAQLEFITSTSFVHSDAS